MKGRLRFLRTRSGAVGVGIVIFVVTVIGLFFGVLR